MVAVSPASAQVINVEFYVGGTERERLTVEEGDNTASYFLRLSSPPSSGEEVVVVVTVNGGDSSGLRLIEGEEDNLLRIEKTITPGTYLSGVEVKFRAIDNNIYGGNGVSMIDHVGRASEIGVSVGAGALIVNITDDEDTPTIRLNVVLSSVMEGEIWQVEVTAQLGNESGLQEQAELTLDIPGYDGLEIMGDPQNISNTRNGSAVMWMVSGSTMPNGALGDEVVIFSVTHEIVEDVIIVPAELTIRNTEVAEITVNPSALLEVPEETGEGAYTVSLSLTPHGRVFITMSIEDYDEENEDNLIIYFEDTPAGAKTSVLTLGFDSGDAGDDLSQLVGFMVNDDDYWGENRRATITYSVRGGGYDVVQLAPLSVIIEEDENTPTIRLSMHTGTSFGFKVTVNEGNANIPLTGQIEAKMTGKILMGTVLSLVIPEGSDGRDFNFNRGGDLRDKPLSAMRGGGLLAQWHFNYFIPGNKVLGDTETYTFGVTTEPKLRVIVIPAEFVAVDTSPSGIILLIRHEEGRLEKGNELRVDEGSGVATYTVTLTSYPSGIVTMDLTIRDFSTEDPNIYFMVEGIPSAKLQLTFHDKTNEWREGHKVIIGVVSNSLHVGVDQKEIIEHAANGGGYDNDIKYLSVFVRDDEDPGPRLH